MLYQLSYTPEVERLIKPACAAAQGHLDMILPSLRSYSAASDAVSSFGVRKPPDWRDQSLAYNPPRASRSA